MERKDCKHKLSCTHAIGNHKMHYLMDCILLKKMPNEKLKVMVFGDRYWKGHDDKKRIRYIESSRVSAK